MLAYVGTRLLLVVPTLFGVTIVTFVLTYILPGNPALVKAGPLATPQHIAEMERRMGLDQPMVVQYGRYLSGLFRGDLGESHTTGRPVLEDLIQRVPATLELTMAALLVALAVFFYVLGVAPPPLGRLGTGITPPPRVTGLLTVDALVAMHWRALGSALHQLVLPALVLGFSVMAPLTRMVRATMLEVLESDYIKAAWAAGLPRRTIVYGDALRNCMIPVITLIGVVFGFLMAGNVVVESVFSWPGIGNYAVAAMMSKDSGPIQSFVLFVGVVYVFVNLAVDLVYGFVDPRIRLH